MKKINNYDSNNKFSTNVFSPQNVISPQNQCNILYFTLVQSQNESRNNDANNQLNKTREEKLNKGYVFPHSQKESFQT